MLHNFIINVILHILIYFITKVLNVIHKQYKNLYQND